MASPQATALYRFDIDLITCQVNYFKGKSLSFALITEHLKIFPDLNNGGNMMRTA
jgi:hypothetical protein